MNSPDTHNSTSSQASEDGHSPSNSQDGRKITQSELVLALASHSATPATSSVPPTRATSGQSSATSSPSEKLQRRLASRLRAQLADFGSPEYVLTWKDWDMQSGPPICALRASGHRTLDKDYIGWPTPDSSKRGGAQDPLKRKNAGHQVNLQDAALLAGWRSPKACDYKGGVTGAKGSTRNPTDYFLTDQVNMLVPGDCSTSCTARTEKRGALNPDHSRWLMGYPAAWGSCGAMAMQSFPNSRQNSSKPTSK